MEGNEWICDYEAKIGRTLSKYAIEKLGRPIHLAYGYGLMAKALDWYNALWERGGLGPVGETFNGGLGGRGEEDRETLINWHYEHECYIGISIDDHPMEFGPISAIEEECKELVLKHKHMPKFAPGIVPPYWTPPEHVDAAIAAMRKYGRYE